MKTGMRINSTEFGAAQRGPALRNTVQGVTPQSAATVSAFPGRGIIVVIESRDLIRDCLARALRTAGYDALALPGLESWLKIAAHTPASAILLSCGGPCSAPQTAVALQRLAQADKVLPAIVLAEGEEPGQIAALLNLGARGYIPVNLSLDVAVEAIRLVNAGGTFVPASCLALLKANGRSPDGTARHNRMFTARQAAVVEAIRKGKPNKTIAYELNLRESTVKVHIRNIMKKLKARNRTEVAYIASNLALSGRL